MPTIKEEMAALDKRNFDWYNNLDEEERKKLSMWVLMRYASSVESKVAEISYHYLTMVNDFVNVHFNTLRHHPELQWRLLQVCAVGTPQFHPWIPPGKNKNVSKLNKKLYEFCVKLYPHLSDDEIALALKLMTEEQVVEMLEDAGISKKEIKDYLK